MSHLNERIADYVFEELSTGEMAESRQHIAECSDCRIQVENFQHTHMLLKTSPDLDPPRNIVFEFERPVRRAAGSFWRWLAPLAATAALATGVAVAAPIHVQWHESQLTISFGAVPQQQPDMATLAQVAQQLQITQTYLQSLQEKVTRDAMMNQIAQSSGGK